MSPTDEKVIAAHLAFLRRMNSPTTTVDGRRGVLRRLARALPCDLLDATHDDLDTWQADLSLTVTASTVQTYSCHVRQFFAWAEDRGKIDDDPARKLPLPRMPKRVARPIPEDELRTALVCAAEPVLTWLLLAGWMGLRACEIAGIRGEDLTESGGRLLLAGVGKGGRSYRVPVPREIEGHVRAHVARQGRGPLWVSCRGRTLDRRDVSRLSSQALHSMGLTHTLHSLRHRFGTQLYAITRDLLVVQEAMRHESPTTTRGYVATASEACAGAVDKLAHGLRPRRRGQGPPTPPG